MDPPRRSLPPATFQPRFTLSLIYLAFFFFLFALLLVAPELAQVQQTGPVEEEAMKRAASEAVQAVARPRLPIALAAALAAVYFGRRTGVLPGLGR